MRKPILYHMQEQSDSKNKKNINKVFSSENIHFYSPKYCSIFHRRVKLMIAP